MDGAFCHYSLIALVSIGMFCNNIIQNYLSNKLWARTFQTSLCQSLVLSLLIVHKFCDECHRHLSFSWLISILWEFDHLSFSFLVKLIHIYPCSRYTHLATLQRFLPSASTFSGVIVFCCFCWVICFSSLKSLSFESRDEILFRGEGCDSSCICNARNIFC
jgi:hypothetical protein